MNYYIFINYFCFKFFTQTFSDKEQGRVVVYVTSMGVVRNTFQRCHKVKQILRNLLVKFDERDCYMNRSIQNEIRHRLPNFNQLALPQVFLEGQHLGVTWDLLVTFSKIENYTHVTSIFFWEFITISVLIFSFLCKTDTFFWKKKRQVITLFFVVTQVRQVNSIYFFASTRISCKKFKKMYFRSWVTSSWCP